MLTRRRTLTGILASGLAGPVAAETLLGDDGLYRQSWFLDSFLDVGDDLRTAAEHGKRFAILWELRGCPYCKQLHKVNFSDETVAGFIRERFDILQLNIIGAREVTDFDGERLPEKRFAAKYGVPSTPTIQFFPGSDQGLAARLPGEREVMRIKGYLPPDDFRRAFAFVADRGYERTTLGAHLDASGPGRQE